MHLALNIIDFVFGTALLWNWKTDNSGFIALVLQQQQVLQLSQWMPCHPSYLADCKEGVRALIFGTVSLFLSQTAGLVMRKTGRVSCFQKANTFLSHSSKIKYCKSCFEIYMQDVFCILKLDIPVSGYFLVWFFEIFNFFWHSWLRNQDIASCDAESPGMEVSLIERLEEIKDLFRRMQKLKILSLAIPFKDVYKKCLENIWLHFWRFEKFSSEVLHQAMLAHHHGQAENVFENLVGKCFWFRFAENCIFREIERLKNDNSNCLLKG